MICEKCQGFGHVGKLSWWGIIYYYVISLRWIKLVMNNFAYQNFYLFKHRRKFISATYINFVWVVIIIFFFTFAGMFFHKLGAAINNSDLHLLY